MTPLNESDKSYWHRYVDFYEEALSNLDRVSAVLEFGVFKGHSIRWLAGRFPEARIVGCDIVPTQESWPISPRIEYERVDQGSVDQMRSLFSRLDTRFDLVIEDGSHEPLHQRNCLIESIPYVRQGGMYVLEDIHTSHPAHEMYRALRRPSMVGVLHLLLATEHLKSIGAEMDEDTRSQLTSNSLFSREDIDLVFTRIETIDIYRRATLPRRCYQCGTSNFDYANLRCRCGTLLYGQADSMSAVLHLKSV